MINVIRRKDPVSKNGRFVDLNLNFKASIGFFNW